MPVYRAPYDKGQLIVHFQVGLEVAQLRNCLSSSVCTKSLTLAHFPVSQVEFPTKDWLPEHLMFQLERLLPPREDVMVTDDMEEVDLCDVEVREDQKHFKREAYEEDDEGPRGGVQCQTQ